MELRERVAKEISRWAEEIYSQADMLEAADAILAIPEIREALSYLPPFVQCSPTKP